MMAKGTSFYGKSDEHAGVEVGDKFRLIKDHHEVHGDLPKGSVTVLMRIVIFQRCIMFKI